MSELDVQFLNHYQVKLEQEHQKFWTDCLGVVWEADEFTKPKPVSSAAGTPDRLFVPLLQGINPDVIELVKENFGLTKEGKQKSKQNYVAGGEYSPQKGEEIISMGTLSKEEFKKKMGIR